MSVNEITTAAGWMAGLAIVALIAAGWRKPARATADPARARRPIRAAYGEEVIDESLHLHRRTSLWRRVWAVIAGTAMSLVVGALLATVTATGLAFLVITLSRMLRQ